MRGACNQSLQAVVSKLEQTLPNRVKLPFAHANSQRTSPNGFKRSFDGNQTVVGTVTPKWAARTPFFWVVGVLLPLIVTSQGSIPMTRRLITVGHSPDPDDAFMFYALAHNKIDTGDLQFRHDLQDIETLNRRALKAELDVSAVSIHAYAHLLDKYVLLPTGCSMGDRY